MAANHQKPSFAEEELLRAQGYQLIAGIDEVGRGALAGPVMAAAFILPAGMNFPWMEQVRDSKQLRPGTRELLCQYIKEAAISVGTGISSHEEIDALGIAKATRLAMKMAVEQLSPVPQYLLIDYIKLPEVPLLQKGMVNGDGLCFSIACASIVAKVTRDRLMAELDGVYSGYGFAQHKGYGTGQHLASLRRLGLCPIHRKSFRPLKSLVYQQRE